MIEPIRRLILRYFLPYKWMLDVVVWTSVTILAYLLRFDPTDEVWISQMVQILPFAALGKLLLVTSFGSYRMSWRNTGFSDFFLIARMVFVYSGLMGIAILTLQSAGTITISLSIAALELLLGIPILLVPRMAARFMLIYHANSKGNGNGFSKAEARRHRVLIVGAGESGTMVARELQKHPEMGMKMIAFVDDKASLQRQKIHGIPVAGHIAQIPEIVEKEQITKIIIAIPSADGAQIRRILEKCRMTKAEYQIVPGFYDLISGAVSINQIRNVDVQDLLQRKPVQLDMENIRSYIHHKTIMVTGAGGSIGSEIVRQLARFEPGKVILLGRGENSIHELVRELRTDFPHLPFLTKIGNIQDPYTLQTLFASEKPEVVFHAAAHKHVPLMEENPEQAIYNNVCGTQNLVNAALEHHVRYFINISTDKAVNPTSVMGATKRIAEEIVREAATRVQDDAVYVSVRFGNVLGSRGSVVPIFKDQIRRGGPVTVTHPDMVRYFMTIPEASQLVLQAGALNMNGAVFVLDMGEPVNIEQMARELIRLSGLEPDVDIEIQYSGIRPGEKMFEELLTAEEGTTMSQHKKIFIARNTTEPQGTFSSQLELLTEAARSGNEEWLRSEIKSLVPTFSKPYQDKKKRRLNSTQINQ